MYTISFYTDRNGRKPILEYLEKLRQQAHSQKSAHIRYKKFVEYMTTLKRVGTRCGMPFVRHMEGDIWELRPTSDRIFFAYWRDGQFVLLHQYIKKSQRTPERELKRAKSNLRNFIERNE